MSSDHRASDAISFFTYDEAESDSFNLEKLTETVADYLGEPCILIKIAQGGFHKVYDVVSIKNSQNLDVVVRVASPVFPRDKMLSEISTLQYIAAFTSVPVPRIFTWNVEVSNPVGAEYMIMQKVPGVAPYGDKWESLPLDIKLNVVKQVATHLAILFSLRFEQAGSLYHSKDADPSQIEVGPIVSLPFYHSLEGIVEYPDISPSAHKVLTALRGPFNSSSEYLASYLHAKLFKMDHFPGVVVNSMITNDPDAGMENARRAINLGLELCRFYPGDQPIPWPIGDSNRPFTLMLDDFRLTNILIDENTGHVNGYIDFEGTTVAPLWLSATVPQWIPDPEGDMANWYGGTPKDQLSLWSAFHTTIDRHDQTLTGGEWRKAYERGKPFRHFVDRLALDIPCWDDQEMESFVQEALNWSKEHPGVGIPVDDWVLHSMR